MESREEEHPEKPWRCFYFMGLKRKPQVAGQKNSVNLNTPVQEFKQQVLTPRSLRHCNRNRVAVARCPGIVRLCKACVSQDECSDVACVGPMDAVEGPSGGNWM